MKRLLSLLFILLLLAGCAPKPSSQTIFCMDTVMGLTVWGRNADDALSRLCGTLNSLDRTWSVTDEDSFLSRFNRGQAQPDEQQAALLARAMELSERTGGAFCPRLQALSRCWGFYNGEYRLPAQEEIAQALTQEQWDLGGFLKGYAGSLCTQVLSEAGVERALLELGGNVQTYGEKPGGEPWRIGIQNPAGGDPLGILSVYGSTAVVTSGDYQRYFEVEGRRYHHILDPRTGYPASSGLSSVTVICSDGAAADALSTALFVLGLEDGTRLWRKEQDFEAVFVCSDGKLYATPGAKLSGCAFEVISP